jgi:hypothetical protein
MQAMLQTSLLFGLHNWKALQHGITAEADTPKGTGHDNETQRGRRTAEKNKYFSHRAFLNFTVFK